MEHNLCEYFWLQKQSLPQVVNLRNLKSSEKTAKFALPKDTRTLDWITRCFLEASTVTSIL